MTGDRTHDALLVDLDGTVYAGPRAIPGAVEALEAAREQGRTVSYVTNNASRAPEGVAEHLRELGFTASADDVLRVLGADVVDVTEPVDPA